MTHSDGWWGCAKTAPSVAVSLTLSLSEFLAQADAIHGPSLARAALAVRTISCSAGLFMSGCSEVPVTPITI